MNTKDAAYRIGHEYPGGAVALAHRIGMNPTVLNSKLNPNTKTHHLTLDEAERIGIYTGRSDIVEAMADNLGYMLMHKPGTIDSCDIDATTRRSVIEFGQWMDAVDTALSDGRVTPNEVRAIERELVRLISRAQTLTAALTAMTGESK